MIIMSAFNELRNIDSRFLLEIHTTFNTVFLCKRRSISTASINNGTDENEVAGVFGYTFPDESESDIYNKGLELERTIPFNQIRYINVLL